MKRTITGGLAAAAVVVFATAADAQTTLLQQNVLARVTVGNQARLTVAGGPVDFADSDPDTVDPIPAGAPVSVSARARMLPGTLLNVTVSASAAFFDPGTDTIPVTGLLWTAAGAPSFAASGAMDTTEQSVASWTGPANQAGTQNYTLANSWDYAPGLWQVTLRYTLSTP
jgi:hypothetical protein